MTKVKFDSDGFLPFIRYDDVEIWFDMDSREITLIGNSSNNIFDSKEGFLYCWAKSNYDRDTYENLVELLVPTFEEMCELYAESDDNEEEIDSLLDDMESIIHKFENTDDTDMYSILDWEDWFVSAESPAFIRKYIENEEYLNDHVYIDEYADDVYEEVVERLTSGLDLDSYESAKKSIMIVYKIYENDDELYSFWNEFVPMIDDKNIEVRNNSIYYENKLII